MKRKELIKTFMMTSNFGLYKSISGLKGLIRHMHV